MQNQEILKIIENLGGRRNYEEKKAYANFVSNDYKKFFNKNYADNTP